jgi:ribonucleoside-diphosphate reductase alpha chain
MYMMIAATLFATYPADKRLSYIRRYYDAISTFKINIPTPVMSGVRTPIRQFASCVLVDVDDTLPSIFNSSSAVGYYIAQRAGIGLNVGRIRAINSKIRGGEVAHTGVIPFLKVFESVVRSCTRMVFVAVVLQYTSQSGTKRLAMSLFLKTTKAQKTTVYAN